MIARILLLAALALTAAGVEVQVALANHLRAVDAEIRALRSLEIVWENTRTHAGAPSGKDRIRSLYAGGRLRLEHVMTAADGQVMYKAVKTFDGTTSYSLDCIGRLLRIGKGLTREPLMEPPQILPLLPATGIGSRGDFFLPPIPTGPDLLPALHLDAITAASGMSATATLDIFNSPADFIQPDPRRKFKMPANMGPGKCGRRFTWSWDAEANRPTSATKFTFGATRSNRLYTIAFSDPRPLRPSGKVIVPFAAHIDFYAARTGELQGTWDLATTSVVVDGVVDEEEFVIEPSLADSIWDADARVWITSHADR